MKNGVVLEIFYVYAVTHKRFVCYHRYTVLLSIEQYRSLYSFYIQPRRTYLPQCFTPLSYISSMDLSMYRAMYIIHNYTILYIALWWRPATERRPTCKLPTFKFLNFPYSLRTYSLPAPQGCQSAQTLHYITLHYITIQCITLHYITLHYITLHYVLLKVGLESLMGFMALVA